VEKLLSALGQRDRLLVVVWLLRTGPMRQVEIQRRLAEHRGKPVNPGEVSALLKPLLDAGIVVRERARSPIAVRDRQQVARLLQAAAALSRAHAEANRASAESDSDELRRALLHQIRGSDTGA
jgi:DNA-binding PadR family transcriptional regulator